jgi:polyphosphate kinase
MVRYLTDSLQLEDDDVYVMGGILGVGDLMQLYNSDRPELRDKPIRMTVPGPLSKKKHFFSAIKKQDVLLHHPYTPTPRLQNLFRQRRRIQKVLAIKICLYRTGKHSPIPGGVD